MNIGDIKKMSCTRLRHFFESKSPKWMIDNLSLEEVTALQMKLNECSREVGAKIKYVFNMIKSSIVQRDRHNKSW